MPLPKQALRAATRAMRQADVPQQVITELKKDDGKVLKKIWNEEKTSSDPRLPHFAKLALMIGASGPAAAMAPLPSAQGPGPTNQDLGPKNTTPKLPKPPGFDVKKQSTNPRMRLVDAMNKGMA